MYVVATNGHLAREREVVVLIMAVLTQELPASGGLNKGLTGRG